MSAGWCDSADNLPVVRDDLETLVVHVEDQVHALVDISTGRPSASAVLTMTARPINPMSPLQASARPGRVRGGLTVALTFYRFSCLYRIEPEGE